MGLTTDGNEEPLLQRAEHSNAAPLSFGLVHQFVLAAGVTIAVSMGLLAVAISQRIEASMLQTAAEEGALFTEFFLGPSAQELATSRSLSPENVKRLDDLLVGKLGERMRLIKIWLPDATLVYSTNKNVNSDLVRITVNMQGCLHRIRRHINGL